MTSGVHTMREHPSAHMPETLSELFALMVRESVEAFIRRIPLTIALLVLGLIIHTFLLVGPNGGFWRGAGLLGDLLSARGNTWGGIVIWTILPALIVGNIDRARRIGFDEYSASFGRGLVWVRESFVYLGEAGQPLLLASAVLALGVVGLFKNNLLGLVLAGCMVSALASRSEGFWFFLLRLTWNDYQRLRGKGGSTRAPFNITFACVATAGAALGFLLGFILPGMRRFGLFVFLVALILFAAVAFWHSSQKSNRQPPTMLFLATLLALTALSMIALPVYADDGGWEEAGGSFGDWIRSEGALAAIVRGFLPTLGLTAGTLVGGFLSGLISDAIGRGVAPSRPSSVANAEALVAQRRREFDEAVREANFQLDELEETYTFGTVKEVSREIALQTTEFLAAKFGGEAAIVKIGAATVGQVAHLGLAALHLFDVSMEAGEVISACTKVGQAHDQLLEAQAQLETLQNPSALTEAEAQLKLEQEKLDQAESAMDAAYDRAQEAYDRLKDTKDTEFFQKIEEFVEETLKVKGPRAVETETGLATGGAVVDHGGKHLAWEGLKKYATKKAGEEGAKMVSFAGAAYYAWEIGEEGAKAVTLVARNIETQWKTWGELFPARIRYEIALREVNRAQAHVNWLKAAQ